MSELVFLVEEDAEGGFTARALSRLGYTVTRQTGSHLRLTTERDG